MKDSLNIVLYVNNFLPKIGGREMVVLHLANTLNDKGHQVRVLGPQGWWRCRNVRFDYPVHRWPTLRGLFKEHVALSTLLLDTTIWGCDIIHAHNTYPTGYTASRLKSFKKDLPLIITPHGVDINTIPEINFGMRLNDKLRPKIDRAIKKADLLTAISDNVEEALMDAGAEKAKIHKIPNGVDIRRFQREKTTDMRSWLDLPTGSKIILTVGNYERRRGHEELVSAMPFILADEPDARLVIVGAKTEALQPLITKLGLDDKVRLTGSIKPPEITGSDEDKLADIYRSSDVYVSAGIAKNAEGLSLALLDGMAAGLPIVGTNISGNRDVIQDGKNGFLVTPSKPEEIAESILKILKDNAIQKTMSAESVRTAEKYDWHEIADMYLELYRTLIN